MCININQGEVRVSVLTGPVASVREGDSVSRLKEESNPLYGSRFAVHFIWGILGVILFGANGILGSGRECQGSSTFGQQLNAGFRGQAFCTDLTFTGVGGDAPEAIK